MESVSKIWVFWQWWVPENPKFDSTKLPKVTVYPKSKYLILMHLIQIKISTNRVVTFN